MAIHTRAAALLGVLTLTVTLTGGTAGATEAAELTDRASIETYLAQLGIDPGTVLFQESAFNYAGPDCPGAGWACTTATGPIVQISQGGINVFEAQGGSTDPNSCVVVQSNTTGANDATCALTTTVNGTTQKARITQTNQSGANSADVDLVANVSETILVGLTAAFDQTIRQQAQVSQRSTSGVNTASILEDLDLSAEARAVGSAASAQDGYAIAILDQVSGAGNQNANITQDQDMASRFSDISGNVRQEQQTRATDRNILTFVTQNSSSGINDLDFNQDQSLLMDAFNILGSITDLQGNDVGGMVGNIDQDSSSATSHYDARQTKTMVADDNANVAIQADDPECCDLLNIMPHTPTTCTIDQLVTLVGPANAEQDAFLHGRAFADTNCDVTLTVSLTAGNVAPTVVTTQRSGTFVDTVIDCDDGACVTQDRPAEEQTNKGNLHLAIRNQTDGQAFHATDPQSPSFTSADAGEVLVLKIEFHNHTNRPINDLRLRLQVPAGTTFLDCSACAGSAPDLTGTVTFNRGTGEPGGVRTGTFRVVVGSASGMYQSQAGATSDRGAIVSNIVRYWIS